MRLRPLISHQQVIFKRLLDGLERFLNQIKNSVTLTENALDFLQLTRDLNKTKRAFESASKMKEIIGRIAWSLNSMTHHLNLLLETASSI